jgi:pyridoxamine 5'-phosphate oxidase
MTQPAPAFYDDLSETLAESWRLIARGTADRRSAFHHPTIATLGLDGRPQLRTVILRACDAGMRRLRFHTDIRSMKVQEIARDGRVCVHFYDPAAKIQLRLDATGIVHTNGDVADAAWDATRSFSRQCYGIAPGPGTAIDAGESFTLPDTSDDNTAPGRANFAAVTLDIAALEWLYLAAQGHRRARFQWAGAGLTSQWLAP